MVVSVDRSVLAAQDDVEMGGAFQRALPALNEGSRLMPRLP